MSASHPQPVPAIMPSIAATIQAKSQGRPELVPTDAATVIMFGRPGLGGRGVPGLFANYSRRGNPTPCPKCNGTGSKPYASMHPMCSDCYGTGRAGVTIAMLEHEARLARELEGSVR